MIRKIAFCAAMLCSQQAFAWCAAPASCAAGAFPAMLQDGWGATESAPALRPASSVVKKSTEKVSQELEAVKKAVGKASCEADNQCKTVAMGEKACGGPEFFLPWSSDSKANPQAGKVEELAAKHRLARQKQIAAEGEMSDCKVVSDPGAQCKAGKCVLKEVKNASAS
ncbi:hypothetical protein V8J88_01720 [Massilia sp. W12]|uniref:hypothetical protein n=1 Tax=Massilia sp. W12 TaxID=3126507 RepID=UPI0030CF4068